MKYIIILLLFLASCTAHRGQFVYKTSEEMGEAWKKAHPNALILDENALYIEFEEKEDVKK